MHLKLEEHGAYRLLLDELWLREGVLEFNVERIARRLGVTKGKFNKIWTEISEFFRVENGQITHSRITAEIENAKKMIEKRSKAGRKGARKKWENKNKNKKPVLASAEQSQCDRNANHNQRVMVTTNVVNHNLPPDGALALERLRAVCGTPGQKGLLNKLEYCIQGWNGEAFHVSQMGMDMYAEQLRPELKEAGVKLTREFSLPEPPAESKKPQLIAIEGGQSALAASIGDDQ